MNKLKKFIGLIKEGNRFKDKLILSIYVFNSALYKLAGLKKNPRLFSEVTIKNKDGIFFCGRYIDACWTASSSYENEIIGCLNIEKGIAIDVGSNIGKITTILSKRLNNRGKILSIEPSKENFEILKENVSRNKLENVILENCAASSKKGVINFYIDDSGTSGHSISKKIGKSEKVKSFTIDELVEKHNLEKVTLLKIDVEGAEADVLIGSKKTLKDHPMIIFEAWNEKFLKKVRMVLKSGYIINKITDENYIAIYSKSKSL